MRPLCSICSRNPCSINYVRKGKTYYRRHCGACARKGKGKKPAVPRWQAAGYEKKTICDKCGFRAKYRSQLVVYHIDGCLDHCGFSNLRTICLNCVDVVTRHEPVWKQGDLRADE